MLNLKNLFLALPLTLALGGFVTAGCAGYDSAQPNADEDQSVEAVDSTPADLVWGRQSFLGTYIGDSMGGRFQTLTLLADQRYHATRTVVCIKAPCNPIPEDGRFSLSEEDGHNLIDFTNNNDTMVSMTFEYIYRNDTLYLRPYVEGGQWYFLNRANVAWCDKPTDCDLQNLPPGICSGDYVCRESACAWQCPIGGPQ